MCNSLNSRLKSNLNDLEKNNKHFNEEKLLDQPQYQQVEHLVMEREAVGVLEGQIMELDPQFLEREALHSLMIRSAKVDEKTQCAVNYWHKENETVVSEKTRESMTLG